MIKKEYVGKITVLVKKQLLKINGGEALPDTTQSVVEKDRGNTPPQH